MSDGQSDDGDAEGHARGHGARDPGRAPRVRVRDHGSTARAGFSDLVEGTVYALLVRIEQRGFVDVEKVPSEMGPPRKVYSVNAQGREQLKEFWRTWSFLAERIEQLHEGEN